MMRKYMHVYGYGCMAAREGEDAAVLLMQVTAVSKIKISDCPCNHGTVQTR